MVYNYLYNPVKSLPYSATAKKNPGAHFKGRPGLLLSSGTKRNEALRLFHFMAPDREDFFSDVRVIVSSGKPFGLRAKTRSEEHTSELQSRGHLVCRLLLEKKKETK